MRDCRPEFGSKAYFDRLYDTSEEPWLFSKRASQRLRFDVYTGILQSVSDSFGSVLDIGCSQGQFTGRLRDLSSKIVAIDISKQAVERARSTHEGIYFEVGGLPFLPHADNSFELVTALEVLYYLKGDNRRKALKEVRRLLQEDGHLLLSVVIGESPYFTCGGIVDLVSSEFSIVQQRPIYHKLHYLFEAPICSWLGKIDQIEKLILVPTQEKTSSSESGQRVRWRRIVLSCARYLGKRICLSGLAFVGKVLEKWLDSTTVLRLCNYLTKRLMGSNGITLLILLAHRKPQVRGIGTNGCCQ